MSGERKSDSATRSLTEINRRLILILKTKGNYEYLYFSQIGFNVNIHVTMTVFFSNYQYPCDVLRMVL